MQRNGGSNNVTIKGNNKRSRVPSSPDHCSMRQNIQLVKGAGMLGLILLTVTSALYGFATTGFSSLWWVILFFAALFACSLATPIALRLVREGLAGSQVENPEQFRSLTPEQSVNGPDMVDHSEKHAERQLLEAIERYGAITPARAALETTLSVAEADRILSELVQKGHLEVRVEDGKLLYTF